MRHVPSPVVSCGDRDDIQSCRHCQEVGRVSEKSPSICFREPMSFLCRNKDLEYFTCDEPLCQYWWKAYITGHEEMLCRLFWLVCPYNCKGERFFFPVSGACPVAQCCGGKALFSNEVNSHN